MAFSSGASLHPADAEQKSVPLQLHRKYPHVQKYSVQNQKHQQVIRVSGVR